MRSPLKHERGSTTEPCDFALMGRSDQRRVAGKSYIHYLLLDHWSKTMPCRGEIARNQNRTGRDTRNKHSQSAANPHCLCGQSLRSCWIAFFCQIKQFLKGNGRRLWIQLAVIP